MKKQSLDEHWLDQPGLTPEQEACVIAASNYTEAMREKALTWTREKAFIITAEAEDGLRIADSEELKSAIGEANGKTLRKWMENPAAVTLNSGWEILRATPEGANIAGMLEEFRRGADGAGWHIVCACGDGKLRKEFRAAWEEGDAEAETSAVELALGAGI